MKPWSQTGSYVAARAYPVFCGMKRLGAFLLPLDGMLVHRRSFPRNFLGFPNNSPYPFIHLGGERHSESKVVCLRTQLSVPDQGHVSRKPRKLFGPVKPNFSKSVSKNRAVYTPEKSCMKGTSGYTKNM